jgi:hypothetical protein
MTTVRYSNHWFDRIPTSLFEWGDFFLALRREIEFLVNSGHLGWATVYLPEVNCECSEDLNDRNHFKLTFGFYDDTTDVSWAAQTIGADHFSVGHDLSWTYDVDDMGKIGELTPEFRSWLEQQETRSDIVAVLAIAVARTWLGNPPSLNSGLALEVRGPWAG